MRVVDVAYVRFRAPDLTRMSGFLSDFGLTPFVDGGVLYGRGLDSSPFIHVTEAGDPEFVALGLRVASIADLEGLADREGATITPILRPGGGYCVTLTDPDNYQIEVVAGQAAVEAGNLPKTVGWNSARRKARLHAVKRTGQGSSHVVRLGHCVLGVADFRRSEKWYKERFGFITSDEITVSEDHSVGAFLRCDRGDEPTDHHSLFLIEGLRGVGFNHAAFEVVDSDDLFAGHEHLRRSGWRAHWGIGRHFLGSQVFDYWRDPWGHTLEHWTDGDLFTAADGSRKAPIGELRAVQWGHAAPHAG